MRQVVSENRRWGREGIGSHISPPSGLKYLPYKVADYQMIVVVRLCTPGLPSGHTLIC
jgi:hypothetical protein